jgi:Fic family protein
MIIPPKYFLTPKIVQLLQTIEGCKQVIDSITIPSEVELNIRRQSTLKSSVFSARIEGNNLTLETLPKASSKDQKKQEIINILKAMNWMWDRGANKDLTLKDLTAFHTMAMTGLIDKSNHGKFRKEVSAIFNAAGIAIYLPPRPSQITTLVTKLVTYINSSREPFVPIRACLAHYSFEKIHPFLDGNGRVGRLLIQAALIKGGYGMKGLLPLEEYLDKHRSEYYRSFENSENDVTPFLEFMLEAIATTAEEAKSQVLEKQHIEAEDYLLPRRAEILRVIKDHHLVNYDMIQRRFMNINARTLRYDLKKLQESNLIKKLGSTNGAYYTLINTNNSTNQR